MSGMDRQLREIANVAKQRRRLPANATCATCQLTVRLSRSRDGQIHCYRHLDPDRAPIERDHWAGHGVLPGALIPLEANAHRAITDLRRAMGVDELPLPDGDPLVLLARLVAGIASLLMLFAQWLAAYAAATRAGLPPPEFPVVP